LGESQFEASKKELGPISFQPVKLGVVVSTCYPSYVEGLRSRPPGQKLETIPKITEAKRTGGMACGRMLL
jgi:hypothetical protein